MNQQNKSFEELLSSLSLIQKMDSEQSVLEIIAEFYSLKRHKEYFSSMRKKALDDNYFLSESDIQEIINMQNSMIEEIRKIDTDQADQIQEALLNL